MKVKIQDRNFEWFKYWRVILIDHCRNLLQLVFNSRESDCIEIPLDLIGTVIIEPESYDGRMQCKVNTFTDDKFGFYIGDIDKVTELLTRDAHGNLLVMGKNDVIDFLVLNSKAKSNLTFLGL